MADTDDDKIYALYFDKEGNGPTVLELVPYDFTSDAKRPEKMPPAFGLQFRFHRARGNFNVNNAPVDAGFFWNRREEVAKLHAALGAWLDKTKPE